MKRAFIIRKILTFFAWAVVIVGITTLLVAANRRQQDHVCQKVQIGIRGNSSKYYIEEADILRQLETAVKGKLVKRPLPGLNLAAMEATLERDPWIRDAELYFDREDVLHVMVDEREPIARVFTTTGSSFYIDSTGHQMSLLEKFSARVPVITGYSLGKRLSSRDSSFLDDVRHLAVYIYNDPFWNAQVGQIDITPARTFELIPVVGDHIIRLGDGSDIKGKLARLLLFYQKVLSKTGFNKYGVVDVQFAGQVIGVNRGPVSAVDSIQLQKNIEELLSKSNIENMSEEMMPDGKAKADTMLQATPAPISLPLNPTPVKPNPNPTKAKDSTVAKPVKIPVKRPVVATPSQRQKTAKPQAPKAVMKKKV